MQATFRLVRREKIIRLAGSSPLLLASLLPPSMPLPSAIGAAAWATVNSYWEPMACLMDGYHIFYQTFFINTPIHAAAICGIVVPV